MSTWTRIKFVLTLTCNESTRLVSQSLDDELPRVERMAVRLHAIGCRSCRRYRRQILFLRQALQTRIKLHDTPVPANLQLSDDARQRMAQALTRAAEEETS